MLVLSRDVGEKIRIGKHGEITIEIVRGVRGRVRLAIDAPTDIPVHREEVFQELLREGAIRPGGKHATHAPSAAPPAHPLDDRAGPSGSPGD